MTSKDLLEKYNVPGPRYTSYPTVPYWDINTFSLQQWQRSLQKSFVQSNKEEGISLYIHLPFCEQMCTFCGCNKRITKRHEVEIPYIKAVLKEWHLYRDLFGSKPKIKELHLGGGTPTFFSPKNLDYLLKGILRHADLAENYEFSFEGHPNNTTPAHLEVLSWLGFTRVSYGVQDYNRTVQKAIHRIQPFENVARVTLQARALGFNSVGHDLIFGLPFQTLEDVKNTIQQTLKLMPERIAFYSYAHVPWIKGNGQRGFDETHLPDAAEKREMYQLGKSLLKEKGYVEIGMDHFALPSDSLYKSVEKKELHRNFMGYTASKTQLMVGLGVSAISDSWYGFAQNVKGVGEYQALLQSNIIPVFRGHILNDEDLKIRTHILNLMCNFETNWEQKSLFFDELPLVLERLAEMEKDGLLKVFENRIEVTAKGIPFIRNVCMAFDVLLRRKNPKSQLFSMTV
ncbi:oxygen-independent coproporphyrinogen III oxidase [Ascidiimonas sp. W6]|uniref:oxygen-independent coproporphyrinogen III oxidase n=1 Tax=Ascidiimonas meishanensis TaxID=3128903 RepID=UPI0030ECC4AB